MNDERIKEIEAQYVDYFNTYKVNNNKIDYNAQTAEDRVHNMFLKMLEEVYYINNKTINTNIKQQQQRSKREKKYKAQYKDSITEVSYNNVETWISEEHVKALALKYKVSSL